jgi:xenotropic and polytropic retrovirus receptor 1
MSILSNQSKIAVKLVKNLQVFFCLYSINWDNPNSCRTSRSRLQGFFSALPGIWRIFQCLRRYYDTRNTFPHLANCGKYTFTILYNMALSMYRIDGNHTKLIVFIIFALCNTFYSCKLSLPCATAEFMC